MSVAALPFKPSPDAVTLAALRANAGVALAFKSVGARTRLADLDERGGFRAKFPTVESGAEAVLINTGGGMLGGDRYTFDIAVERGAAATVTSQSAERIYRALDGPTRTDVSLRVDSGALVAWLPQETILFNGARLDRRMTADVAVGGSLLIAETIVFGRQFMGEDVRAGSVLDHWRIRREGRLVFADSVALQDDMHGHFAAPATGDGARAIATVVLIAPDAADQRDAAREALGEPAGRAAISAWNGMLTARFLAREPAALRADLIRVVTTLARRPMPRVWNC